MKLRINDNLHIINGDIISYSTVVGRLTSTGIVANGKYSRSTTKHFGKISHMTGLAIRYVTEQQQYFSWYSYGIKCRIESCVSPTASVTILSKIKAGSSDLTAASIMALPELKERDRSKCITQLEEMGVTRDMMDDILTLITLGLV